LIIDDEADFADYVRRVAEGIGCEVRATNEAGAFKRAYEDFDPDVIVLDMVMPEVDGIELVNWLAEQQCRAKLIIVTGYSHRYAEMASVLSAAKGMPPATALTKPVRLADLRAALA
jgi:CheY-like chemotaxis protein